MSKAKGASSQKSCDKASDRKRVYYVLFTGFKYCAIQKYLTTTLWKNQIKNWIEFLRIKSSLEKTKITASCTLWGLVSSFLFLPDRHSTATVTPSVKKYFNILYSLLFIYTQYLKKKFRLAGSTCPSFSTLVSLDQFAWCAAIYVGTQVYCTHIYTH